MIANADASLWKIDADSYDEANIQGLVKLASEICKALPDVSGNDALKTKIVLGVFGSVPGFDSNVSQGCIAEGIGGAFKESTFKKIGALYQRNAAVIDNEKYRVPTLDFVSGNHTQRRYTRAKVIDMAVFVEGEKRLKRKDQEKEERKRRKMVNQSPDLPSEVAVPML